MPRALLAALQGISDAADRLLAQARPIATEHGLEEHWVHAIAHIALAHAREGAGEQSAARTEAERALQIVRRGPRRLETALALVTVARLVLERARQSMAEAQHTIASRLDPSFLRAHALRPRRPRAAARGEQLSDRELEVLRLLFTRPTMRKMGNELYVSANTVKTHARSIYHKLNVCSRAEAAAGARRLDLLSPGDNHLEMTRAAPMRAAECRLWPDGQNRPPAASTARGAQ